MNILHPKFSIRIVVFVLIPVLVCLGGVLVFCLSGASKEPTNRSPEKAVIPVSAPAKSSVIATAADEERTVSPAEPLAAAKTMEEACLKIALNDGKYHVLCCFSCRNLKDPDPLARSNQFMAATFLKAGLAKKMQIPEGKFLKIKDGKYLIPPFREGDFLVYTYEIAVSDCSELPKQQ